MDGAMTTFRETKRKIQKPAAIERANKHMNQLVIGGIVGMFIYGLLLPTDWQQRFGLAALPIDWAVENVPSIAKMAEVSPIPELIKGFYGIGVYVSPLFGLLMVSFCGALGARIRYAFSRPDQPFWKTVSIIYLLCCPFILLCLWLYYINPTPEGVLGGNTRGSRIFITMLKYRFNLALFGSVATIGFGVFVWMLIVALVGPIILFIKGDKNGDNDL
jgi:hypothetical protein